MSKRRKKLSVGVLALFAGCKSPSLWERWHRAAMTERASPSPESRHAAISRFFGRAMLSLRLLFSVSILALSGAPRQLSQRESLRQRAGFAGCKSLSLWERWHRASDDGEGKPVSREPPHSDKQVLWQSDAIAAPALLRQHPCPLRRSAPALPKGEPKGILPDGFSPFTQETGRFAQVLLIFLRRCGTFRVIRHPLFFTVQRRFLYVILS